MPAKEKVDPNSQTQELFLIEIAEKAEKSYVITTKPDAYKDKSKATRRVTDVGVIPKGYNLCSLSP